MSVFPAIKFNTYNITSGIDLPDARLYINNGISGSFNVMDDLIKLSSFMKNTPRHFIEEITIYFTIEGFEDFNSFIVFQPTRDLGKTYIYFICDYIHLPHDFFPLDNDRVEEIIDEFKLHVIRWLESFFYRKGFPDLVENLVRHMRIRNESY